VATETNIVYPGHASTYNAHFSRHGTLLDAATLKRRYLHGVSFTDNDGNDMPEETFTDYIIFAISTMEHKFDITIEPVQYVEEPYDYNASDYRNYSFIQLHHKPVISMDQIKLQFIEGEDLVTFPEEWFRLYHLEGQIQVTPTSGALSTFNLSGSGFLPRIFGARREYPQLIKVTYTAGFEQNKIPMIINDLIGLYASIGLLDIAGDLILGAGIAQQSISLDGLSQAISSTSSATNAGYGARIISYNKRIEKLEKIIKSFYSGQNMMVSV